MHLPGRLGSATLGDLLGRLYRAGASGVLELDTGGALHRLFLQRGLVAGVALDVAAPPSRLGEILVGEGLSSAATVAQVLSAQQLLDAASSTPTHTATRGRAPRARDARTPSGEAPRPISGRPEAGVPRLGELLVLAGVLTPEIRDAALRRQARSRLDALFRALERFDPAPGGFAGASDITVRFHVGVSAAETRERTVARPAAPLTAREFLHGRRRARGAGDVGHSRGRPDPRDRSNRAEGGSRPDTEARAHTTGPSLSPERARALRLLGVAADADTAVIRRAFRIAAARIHPDRHAHAPASERAHLQSELAELSAAYHLLCA